MRRSPLLPKGAIAAVYDFIGEQPFAHDFDNVEFDAVEFDAGPASQGRTQSPAACAARNAAAFSRPDLIHKYQNDAFWRDPTCNPNEVRVV
jgi:sulfotransferase